MTQFGYTAMGEQTPARQLITDLVAAEAAGFDFSVMSDHYFPWLEEQGHSPNAWAVLGAVAQATERLPLMGQKAPWTSENTAAAADRRAESLETRARTNMP